MLTREMSTTHFLLRKYDVIEQINSRDLAVGDTTVYYRHLLYMSSLESLPVHFTVLFNLSVRMLLIMCAFSQSLQGVRNLLANYQGRRAFIAFMFIAHVSTATFLISFNKMS